MRWVASAAMVTPSYSQGHAPSVLRSQTWRSVDNSARYLAAHLRPGANVLDVGCGTGTITVDMARRVAPGRVVGVDREAKVIAQARRLAQDSGVGNAEFVVGDVHDLPTSPSACPGEGFDVVHAHQLLLHLEDPVGALREMLAVVGRGESSASGTPITPA